MFRKYAEISFQYVNLLLLILFSLNFIFITLLSRIARLGFKSTKANLTMVSINSFLHMCIHQLLKHMLVRGLHHIVAQTIGTSSPLDFQPSSIQVSASSLQS
jgi:hypothetical protein